MKSTAEYLYGSYGKYWNAIQFSILAGIFFYYFSENFILSESWEILTLRSIDDYAMQDSVHSMQMALLTGNWTRIFGCFDYAYGNAFWLLNSILLLPLYFINDAQTMIVVGRQISLFFVFGSIYIVSLIIDRIRPDAASLKFPILIAIATMPMVSVISTKLHVNAQSIFFGILSFYLLVRETEISKRSLKFSAVFAGVAVGFKLTGVFIVPLLCITLLDKLRKKGFKKAVIDTGIYLAISLVIAAACTAPGLLLFPFYINELGATYKTFLLFKNMASAEVQVSANVLVDAFRFYFSPLSFMAIFVSFLFLIFDDAKNRRYISVFILGSIASTLLLVVLIVHKGPVYIATYFISVAFFVPLGLLGICTLKFLPSRLMNVLAYCVVIAGFVYGAEQRAQILAPYNFFEMVKNEKVKRQMLALAEIKQLVFPLKFPVRILQDSTSIFPATRFTDGVEVTVNYGDLKEKSTWDDFDYILLNSDTYYGKISDHLDPSNIQLNAQQLAKNLEESTRSTLRNTGDFYGRKYRLIYSGYDALLYKLEKSKNIVEVLN
jgi:hypothetical protein